MRGKCTGCSSCILYILAPPPPSLHSPSPYHFLPRHRALCWCRDILVWPVRVWVPWLALCRPAPPPQSLVGPDMCASCLLLLLLLMSCHQETERDRDNVNVSLRFIFTPFVLYFCSETCWFAIGHSLIGWSTVLVGCDGEARWNKTGSRARCAMMFYRQWVPRGLKVSSTFSAQIEVRQTGLVCWDVQQLTQATVQQSCQFA